MTTISIQESFSFGWKTFTARPWIFVQAGLVIFAISLAFNIVGGILGAGSEAGGPVALVSGLLSFAFFVFSIYVSVTVNNMGVTAFYLKAHETVSAITLRDLYRPHPFWKYVGAAILSGLIVIVGFVLLIVPGIIAAVVLFPALILVVDKGLGPIPALKEAVRLTKGNRWKIFLLGLAVMFANIVGMLVLFVGLLVSVPVSFLAAVHAYRTLVGSAVPAAPTEPSAPAPAL